MNNFVTNQFNKLMAITTYQYKGDTVSFDVNGKIMVNATQMAKPFGKNPADFLKTQNIKEFIQILSVMKKIITADLVVVRRGGNSNEQGTWMHEDLAMEFARWLSPQFAIWCNDRIKEILKMGLVSEEMVKEWFRDGKIKLSVPEIRGLHGGRYVLLPSEYWDKRAQWTHTNFYINDSRCAVTTAIMPDGMKWYCLPQLIRFMGHDESTANGIVRSYGLSIMQMKPFGKGYKRYFIPETLVGDMGFSDNNTLEITGEKHLGTRSIPHFEAHILALINQVKTLPEKEFLIDIYKLLK